MNDKYIKVICDNIITIYDRKTDVANKYNFTPQHICGILKGKKKDNFIVHDKKIISIEYADLEKDKQLIENLKNKIENDKKQKNKEKKKEYNKKMYEKRKIKNDSNSLS